MNKVVLPHVYDFSWWFCGMSVPAVMVGTFKSVFSYSLLVPKLNINIEVSFDHPSNIEVRNNTFNSLLTIMRMVAKGRSNETN